MNQQLNTAAAPESSTKRGWTKARALLAGGLVLGVGAAITLAAWTDQEWAIGNFASGSFGIEGSTDGMNFASHPTEAEAARLAFTVAADQLGPGDEVYAGYSVRLHQDATREASVTVDQDESDSLTGVTATYVYTASATCDEPAFAAGTNADGTAFDLESRADVQHLCVQLSADDTLPQGKNGSVTWQFSADSGDAL